MSAATVDRYLKPARDKMRIKGVSMTKPSPLLRNSITITYLHRRGTRGTGGDRGRHRGALRPDVIDTPVTPATSARHPSWLLLERIDEVNDAAPVTKKITYISSMPARLRGQRGKNPNRRASRSLRGSARG